MSTSKLRYKGDRADEHRTKRRRRVTPERPSEKRDESLTPPRNGWQNNHASSSRLKYDEYIFDDSDFAYIPASARFDQEGRLPSLEEGKAFQEKLYEAMREDEGLDAHESVYGATYVPPRWRSRAKTGLVSEQIINHQGAVLNQYLFEAAYSKEGGMTDEEYAEHMRTGMFRRTHKEELQRQEELERERKEKEAKIKLERERLQREEAEKLKKVEEKKRMKALQASKQSREAYSFAWKTLLSSTSESTLSYSDFPWPFSIDQGSLDKTSILAFLTSHIPNSKGEETIKAKKQALRTAVLAYHPDRFDRYVNRVPEARSERQRVKEMGLRVSQLLNELLTDI